MTNKHRFIMMVRHGTVHHRWKGVCYGQQDVPLCEHWMNDARPLIEQLSVFAPTTIFHSGLVRTRWLADQVADVLRGDPQRYDGVSLAEDPRLRERHYGDWECKTWDEAYQSDPDHFHDLIAKPDTYRPPAGETTSEMQRRIVQWYQSLPMEEGAVLAVSHSGPIAALAGHLLGLHAMNWNDWMLATGEAMVIESPIDGKDVRLRRGICEQGLT
jgi:broad specificity phosphatase PhoE